jgi:hypothetical protein
MQGSGWLLDFLQDVLFMMLTYCWGSNSACCQNKNIADLLASAKSAIAEQLLGF